MQDDYPLPDDGEAEEARLREEERERIDAAASLDRAQDALRAAGQQQYPTDAEEALDPHGEERAALGFDLPWWAEEGEHGTPQVDICVDLANNACGRTHYMRDLEKFGYTPDAEGLVALDSISGPLVVAGLMILGTMHSHIRDEVTEVLKKCWAAIPTPSEEEEESYRNAAAALDQERLASFAEQMGVRVVSPQEFAEEQEDAERQRREAELN